MACRFNERQAFVDMSLVISSPAQVEGRPAADYQSSSEGS